jgi:heme exporter protein D
MAVPHIGFILAAYAVTAFVLLGLGAAVLLDGRGLRRALAGLEARAGRGRASSETSR